MVGRGLIYSHSCICSDGVFPYVVVCSFNLGVLVISNSPIKTTAGNTRNDWLVGMTTPWISVLNLSQGKGGASL